MSLHYVRTKEGREVDFALASPERVSALIEVKLSEHTLALGLKYLARELEVSHAYQVVQNLRQPESISGLQIVKAADWLAMLSA
jgi:predicted transcriptional regulator